MSTSHDRSGTQLGPYLLVRRIGRGGMGEVYEATDTRKDRTVALKLLPTQLADDAEYRTRFLRESQTAARLNDPHVIPIHDFGEIDGQLFLDMRIVDGGDLRARISGGPIPQATAVDVVSQIAGALDTAHAAGLTHRDVKPENILLDARDFAYLVDFGLVQSAGQGGLTSTGLAIGSFNYMAPERFGTGAPVGPSSDIYALGCVLYECLTGAKPFGVDSMEQIIAGHLHRPLPPTGTALDAVIARGTAKDQAQRYQTAGHLAEAARRALTGATPTVLPVAPFPTPAPPLAGTQVAPVGYAQQHPQFGGAPTGYPIPSEPVAPAAHAKRNPLVLAIATVAVLTALAGGLWFWQGSKKSTTEVSATGGAASTSTSLSPATVTATAPTQSTVTETVTPKTTAAPETTATGDRGRQLGAGDLGLSTPISSPACNGDSIAVVYNAVTPGAYAEEISNALRQYPGAAYLRTDQSCLSLKQSEYGNPIYAVYFPGATLSETCTIKARMGGGTYARVLDNSTPVGTEVC